MKAGPRGFVYGRSSKAVGAMRITLVFLRIDVTSGRTGEPGSAPPSEHSLSPGTTLPVSPLESASTSIHEGRPPFRWEIHRVWFDDQPGAHIVSLTLISWRSPPVVGVQETTGS